MPGWDKRVDYETVKKTLDFEISWRLRNLEDVRNKRILAYCAVLYTQLENGCRVGEAVSAVRGFISDKVPDRHVKVEKRKDNYYRLVVIPPAVRDLPLDGCNITVGAVKNYARRLGFNTHSLRYCFITRMAKQGVNPAVLATVTGHKSLDMLLHYLQKDAGEQLLRDKVNGKVA